MSRENYSRNALKRYSRKRSARKSITVVCEGKETEPNYFKSLKYDLRLSMYDVKIIPGITDPLNLVQRGISEKEKSDYKDIDEVWCVLDKEQYGQNPNFDNAVKLALTNGISLAVTNPAFELWYLLHFEYTDAPFNNATEVIKRLLKFIPKYEKNMEVYPLISENTKNGIDHAKRIKKNRTKNWDSFPNPCTTVYKPVLSIHKLKIDIKAGKV